MTRHTANIAHTYGPRHIYIIASRILVYTSASARAKSSYTLIILTIFIICDLH